MIIIYIISIIAISIVLHIVEVTRVIYTYILPTYTVGKIHRKKGRNRVVPWSIVGLRKVGFVNLQLYI